MTGVTLKSPDSFATFVPRSGKEYQADTDGLIHDVHPGDVIDLVNAGCQFIVQQVPA